jgi:hypothetical protein
MYLTLPRSVSENSLAGFFSPTTWTYSVHKSKRLFGFGIRVAGFVMARAGASKARLPAATVSAAAPSQIAGDGSPAVVVIVAVAPHVRAGCSATIRTFPFTI